MPTNAERPTTAVIPAIAPAFSMTTRERVTGFARSTPIVRSRSSPASARAAMLTATTATATGPTSEKISPV